MEEMKQPAPPTPPTPPPQFRHGPRVQQPVPADGSLWSAPAAKGWVGAVIITAPPPPPPAGQAPASSTQEFAVRVGKGIVRVGWVHHPRAPPPSAAGAGGGNGNGNGAVGKSVDSLGSDSLGFGYGAATAGTVFVLHPLLTSSHFSRCFGGTARGCPRINSAGIG